MIQVVCVVFIPFKLVLPGEHSFCSVLLPVSNKAERRSVKPHVGTISPSLERLAGFPLTTVKILAEISTRSWVQLHFRKSKYQLSTWFQFVYPRCLFSEKNWAVNCENRLSFFLPQWVFFFLSLHVSLADFYFLLIVVLWSSIGVPFPPNQLCADGFLTFSGFVTFACRIC